MVSVNSKIDGVINCWTFGTENHNFKSCVRNKVTWWLWLSRSVSLAILRTGRCVPSWLSCLRTSSWTYSVFSVVLALRFDPCLLSCGTGCRAMLCISAAIAVMRCPSICHVRGSCQNEYHIFENISPSGSHSILVFPYQTGWRYSDGNTLNGGVECRWGIGTNRDSGLIAGYRRLLDVRSAKNIYWRRSWVYDTVGHAPLAIHRLLDVRTTKWQKHFFSYACHLP